MKTVALQAGLVYGPVRSRRLGISLGVNVLPDGAKVCTFNCAYCQYGWTHAPKEARALTGWPEPVRIAEAVETALGCTARVDRITLAGNGEPTLHPRFGEIVERLRDVRARVAPKARLAVLSNASTAAEPLVAAALVRLDDCHMKLDAGDAATLKAVNGVAVDPEATVEALSQLGGVTLQALFVRDPEGRVDNTTARALAAWLGAVRRVRPVGVQLYSLDRTPALPRLEVVPRPELAAIAARVEAMGIPARVF
jgi:wyosine [tRNA(Phe)-imidazoG37] synthetase (radical SAM superfamily)